MKRYELMSKEEIIDFIFKNFLGACSECPAKGTTCSALIGGCSDNLKYYLNNEVCDTDETAMDILDGLTDDQKEAVCFIINEAFRVSKRKKG